MNKTKRMIELLDSYLSLVRYQYTTQEKLSRLKILEDYYMSASLVPSVESFSSEIETAEELGKGFSLPLKVRGVFLTEGRPKRKFYTAEEMMKAVNNPVNKKFPLMLDHKDNEASKVIGMVDKLEYDESIKGIRWWGHINDETFARNVMDGAITQVSATIYSVTSYSDSYGVIGSDLTFKELSLVMAGSEPNNYIEVDTE